jgi:hypothetical protein
MKIRKESTEINKYCYKHETLNREPIEENFDDLEESSGRGGNKLETKEHLDALSNA